MQLLTKTEKWGVFLLAAILLGGLVTGRVRHAVGVRYRYRAADLRFIIEAGEAAAAGRRRSLAARRLSLYVDPNTAERADLESLPGVGPVIAGRIIEQRRQRPFRVPEDLERVPGIGPRTLERMLPYLEIGAPGP